MRFRTSWGVRTKNRFDLDNKIILLKQNFKINWRYIHLNLPLVFDIFATNLCYLKACPIVIMLWHQNHKIGDDMTWASSTKKDHLDQCCNGNWKPLLPLHLLITLLTFWMNKPTKSFNFEMEDIQLRVSQKHPKVVTYKSC